jgi:hypothetical protein
MTLKKGILFNVLLLTGCFSVSQGAAPQGFETKYYCEEFSVNPPAKRNWRNLVLNELKPEKYPLFFESDPTKGGARDINKYCPNFSNLEVEEKKIILLRILDAMVFFESSCEVNAAAKGPNGEAFGILQLHLGREHDYARNCKKNDSKTADRSLICGMAVLHDQVQNENLFFSSASYWDVLRPRGPSRRAYTVASHIWYYPNCQKPK